MSVAKTNSTIVAVVALIVVFGIMGACSGGLIVVVPAGHRAVIFSLSDGVLPGARGEGMSFVVPFVQTATLYDVRTQAINSIIRAHPYPQLAMDKCFGILYSLRKKYGDSKLEATAEYAIRAGFPTYRMIKELLKIEGELPKQLAIRTNDSHQNIRGPQEYAKEAVS